MFESTQEGTNRNFWRFMVLAGVIFAALVALVLFLSGPEAQEEQELTGIIRSPDTNFEWYSQYLQLKNTKLEMGLNFAGNRIVMISGVVVNGGERTIDVVEVKITFFNYKKPVGESLRTPIKPSPYTPPIPPLTSRAITFYIEEFPEGWKSSHAEIELNGFRFLGAE